MERWLSLTVSKIVPPEPNPKKARVHISIPKRTVRLAVRRNRLKRVLREAVRMDPFFGHDKVYLLKVLKWPENTDLQSARQTLGTLHD